MRFFLFHRNARRIASADEAAHEAERVRERIQAQWPEVLRHAQWARETRQRNHLTDLFFDARGRKSS